MYNPPFIMGRVVLPIVLSLMSRKLRARFAVVNGANVRALRQKFPLFDLPTQYGGTFAFDAEAPMKCAMPLVPPRT